MSLFWGIATSHNEGFPLICQRVRQCQTDLDLLLVIKWRHNIEIPRIFKSFTLLIYPKRAIADLFIDSLMVKSEKSTFAKFMRKMSPSPSDFLFNQFFFSILGKTIDLFMIQITHCQNCTIDDEAQEWKC